MRVARTEVHRGVGLARQAAARQHAVARTVGGECHVLGGRTQIGNREVVQLHEVLLVASGVAAVLVLDLDHDDATAVHDHVGRENGQQGVHPLRHGLHVLRILGSDLDAVLLQQPVGKTAELPLCTDVGSGANNDEETVLLRKGEITVQIVRALKVELSALRLVHVPSDIGFHGVHSRIGQLLEGILPAIGVDTEVVEGGRHELDRLSIQEVGILRDGEVAREGNTEKSKKEKRLCEHSKRLEVLNVRRFIRRGN